MSFILNVLTLVLLEWTDYMMSRSLQYIIVVILEQCLAPGIKIKNKRTVGGLTNLRNIMHTKCYCSFYFLRYLDNQSSVTWYTIQSICQMAQTLFSRCTRKLSRSVFIQMTHHQLVFYETTHGPLKQPNDIKTNRPTWIMNNGLCSLPDLIKMKETVIWFKKSYSCLYQICLWWSWGEGCCWPCMDSVCYVLHWFFQSSCLLYQGCILYQGIEFTTLFNT